MRAGAVALLGEVARALAVGRHLLVRRRRPRDDPRAFGLAALIGECGAEGGDEPPGTVLYRDRWQIVAKPDEATPVTWN